MSNKTFLHHSKQALLMSIFAIGLSGCSSTLDKLSKVGDAPELTPIVNPTTQADYRPVSLPQPVQRIERRRPNSLWAAERKTFFEDQRANNVGDILTVVIDLDETAEIENESTRSRQSSEDAGLPNFLGYESRLTDVLPEGLDPANLANVSSGSNYSGEGEIEREESIEVRIAALITQILPNGNLVIQGSQELRVNFEKRVVTINGIIRPEDITPVNTINHDQIAEARISYGGEGQITDVQQPRYGQQVYDILFPF